jgi:hypothetical protein
MGELSFLTIIVSLAVCSLLSYAVFQYMKVRLTNLEQSHKEQALILQQFIEESSTDIHRLYQIKSPSSSHNNNNNNDDNDVYNAGGYHGSIILEYANARREYEEKPIAYNEPHMIHLDTALFQNKRTSNLIEISSDSEDTTDNDDESASDESEGSGSASDDESASSASSASSESASEANGDEHIDSNVTEFAEELVVECVNSVASPETKTITVNLGTITSSEEQPLDVMDMLYKKATSEEANDAAPAPLSASFTGMSVTELRFLLKEKYKQQPEKHAEIQKMKKAELIQALQQAQ